MKPLKNKSELVLDTGPVRRYSCVMPRAIVCFLGNPGQRYAKTRHNVAWRLLDTEPLRALGAQWQQKFKARVAGVRLFAGDSAVLLVPQTLMNRVGESVQPALAFYRLGSGKLIVVHDESEIAFGELRERHGGGLAGHNGLRSIAQSIGSPDFHRFAIGVGRPSHGTLSGHVLGRFSEHEEARLPEVLESAARRLLERLSTV